MKKYLALNVSPFVCALVGITLILSLFLPSCTQYEVRNTIYPEVTIVGDKVGISYMLGPIKVNDELTKVNSRSADYFIKNKGNIKLDLVIEYNENKNNETRFKYYIAGILLSENRNVVRSDVLLAHRDSIPGFTLITLEGDVVQEKSQATPHVAPKVESTPIFKLLEQKPIEDKGDNQL